MFYSDTVFQCMLLFCSCFYLTKLIVRSKNINPLLPIAAYMRRCAKILILI